MRRDTKTLRLLIKLITDEGIELIGNSRLVGEYSRLAEQFDSKTSKLILQQLMGKMKTVAAGEKALRRCKSYLPEKESADAIHAATCLQTKGILITNDTDFNRIKQAGVIKVWSVSGTIRKILR